MIEKLNADCYLLGEGDFDLYCHYSDTSLVFKIVDNVIYSFDRDAKDLDVLSSPDPISIVYEYLGSDTFELFKEDFWDKGFTLNSDYDTFSVELSESEVKNTQEK